jgi:HK97 gp10 family phage protein
MVNVITQQALNEGAKIIKEEAILNAIKIDNKLDHNLKVNGVYIRLKAGNLSRNIRRRTIRKAEKGTKEAQVYVYGKFAWYAKFVEGLENGTSRQPTHPLMRAAFETKKQEAYDAFENKVSEAVRDGGL